MHWTRFTSILALAAFALTAVAAEKGRYFSDADGVALMGYDVVAYTADNAAKPGSSNLSTQHDGVVFHFSSAANRDAFRANPDRYLPQYGGWCAFAMGAKNTKFEANPETFKVVDGKLYLFYNAEQGNTLPLWNKDEAKLKLQADANWAEMHP